MSKPQSSVDLLIRSNKVVEVDSTLNQVIFDPPVDFDFGKPIYCNGTPVPVIHGELDSLWVEDLQSCQVGSTLAQMKFTGDLQELFAEFESAWSERWNRHLHVPESQWQTIVDFTKRFLPRHQCE